MAVTSLPIYSLPASKFLSSITTFVNQLRFKDTLKPTNMVKNFVNNSKVGKVDTGKGIVFTFKKDLQPVSSLSKTSSVLTVTDPKVEQEIIAIDTYNFIPLSVSRTLLYDAVPEGNLVDTWLNYLYSLLEDTQKFHEFDVLLNTLLLWSPTQATQTITIDLIDTTGMTGAELVASQQWNASEIAKKIRKTINNLQNKSKAYTDVATTMTALDKSDLRIIMNDTFETNFLADAMASLYHSDKVGEMVDGLTKDVLNEDVWTGANVNTICYLMDKEKLAMADFYKLQMSFTDASTLYTNSFLHFAYGVGIFKNAVGIKFVANYITPTP
ncbi:MAG: hypothetical protein LIR50_22090 [Bacillota bacterium]|nr:hypothetical protein [Bacillota bacterium]